MSKPIIYPPGEILNPTLGKSDYEYIILWMLNNNKICEWSDFTAEISESTLSGHLKKLLSKGYIDKPEKGKYLTTFQGKDRFNDLSFDKKSGKRRLKYPPKVIMKRRNYDHWILWMIYNNYSCKWSDFKQVPLSINQSSLSNNLNSLIENKFVLRENKEYTITPLGKIEYLAILKLYDMDRQSILEQESKRIKEITVKTREFFYKHKIEDEELQFRYLDHVLKLNYSKVKELLKDEEDFNKILLFLSSNHPYQYPNYISPEDFSLKYRISRTTLDYYIKEIVDNQLFRIKFFKLVDNQTKIYYFQKGEPLEKLLNATVEKYITKFTYLNKFQENPTINIDLLLECILDDVCGKIFNENLKVSLKTFLLEYIKHLAYKIETERKLVDKKAKLEGFVWQNIFEEFQTFQTFEPSRKPLGKGTEDQYYYALDRQIFSTLDIFFINKLNFLKTSEVLEKYHLNKLKIFKEIGNYIFKNKFVKAQEVYDSNTQELDELEDLILKDLLTTAEIKFEDSLNLTIKIIKKFPKEFIGYLLQSITFFLMDDYDRAIESAEQGLKEAPNVLLICQKAQIIMKIMDSEKASNFIQEYLQTYPENTTLLRIKILIDISLHFGMKDSVETLKQLNFLLKLDSTNKELIILKSMFYCAVKKYKEAKRILIKEIEFNIFKKNPRIETTSYFILVFSYIALGKFEKALKIANHALDIYSNHPTSYLTKAIVLGYNLIYKFIDQDQESNIETLIGWITRAISLETMTPFKAKYLQLQAFFLNETRHYEQAIEAIDSAIELFPTEMSQYFKKIYFLMTSKKNPEALELIEELSRKYPELRKKLYRLKSFIYFSLKDYEEGLRIVDETLELVPDDMLTLNNKAIFLGYLLDSTS